MTSILYPLATRATCIHTMAAIPKGPDGGSILREHQSVRGPTRHLTHVGQILHHVRYISTMATHTRDYRLPHRDE